MSKILLIESGPFETRVAVLEDGLLAEVHIERPSQAGLVGNIYKGRVSRVVPGIQAAFVDIGQERDAFLFAGDLSPTAARGRTAGADRRPELRPVEEVMKEGAELLVQVVKEPLGEKGARLSVQLSLPGRFLVLLPGSSDVGISRRIGSEADREELDRVLRESLPEGVGVIARTAAAGRSRAELVRELDGLQRRWQALARQAARKAAPAAIELDSSLPVRALRDLVDPHCDEILVEGKQAFAEIVDFVRETDPALAERLHLYEGEPALFDRFRVEHQISKAMQRRVWLRSGGFIVIDPTEALVAIDVNSGRNTDGTELEETALATNLEAVPEIARAIRLRDLTGIIVVDFIDMLEPDHRESVMAALEGALASDRSRSQLSQMSDFGLAAITRKRTRAGLRQQLTVRCTCCEGTGRLKDPLTIGLELDRALRRRHDLGAIEGTAVRVHPRVKRALQEEYGELWRAMAERVAGGLELEADERLGPDRFEISTGDRSG